MRVLLTGASGFLGRHVLAALAAEGHDVVAAGRTPVGPPAAEDVPLDLADDADLGPVVERVRPQTVVHAAAYGVAFEDQDAVVAARINVVGTLRLFDAAARAGGTRFVHVGTGYEYGSAPERIAEDAPLNPQGIYGSSKAAAALLVEDLARQGRAPAVLVRPFGMFGPGEGPHKLVPQILRAVETATPLDLTPGEEVRDYTYVKDVAGWIAAIATASATDFPAARALNLCSGRPTTIRELVTEIAACLGGLELMRFGRRAARPGAPRRVVGDPGRFERWCESIGRVELARRTSIKGAISDMTRKVRR